jgi:hypothetical protein
MTNDNQIEMLNETIDKGKADKAAEKAAEKLARKEAAELKSNIANQIKAARAFEAEQAKDSRVEALLAFNAKYSNGPEFDNNGDTLRVWAERVC